MSYKLLTFVTEIRKEVINQIKVYISMSREYCFLSNDNLRLVCEVKIIKDGNVISDKVFIGRVEQDVFHEAVKECYKYISNIMPLRNFERMLEEDYQLSIENYTFEVSCNIDCCEYKII